MVETQFVMDTPMHAWMDRHMDIRSSFNMPPEVPSEEYKTYLESTNNSLSIYYHIDTMVKENKS